MSDPDSSREFLDTNVLVYAYDESHPQKQEIAQRILLRGLKGDMVVSTQTLAEFAATLLHKAAFAMTPQQVRALLDILAPIRLVTTDGDTVRRAVEVKAAYGLHLYDGMIVAAAERGGCNRILSEDLNAGQSYFGVTVANPFE